MSVVLLGLPGLLVARFAFDRGWSRRNAVLLFVFAYACWPVALGLVLTVPPQKTRPEADESQLPRDVIPRWWLLVLAAAFLVLPIALAINMISQGIPFDFDAVLYTLFTDVRSLGFRLLVIGTVLWLLSFLARFAGRRRLSWPVAIVHPVAVALMLVAVFVVSV